jgi:hypothetical protein
MWDRNLKLLSEEEEKEETATEEDDLSLLMGNNILQGIDEESEALFTEEADFFSGEDEEDFILGDEPFGEIPESFDFSEEREGQKYDDSLDALAEPAREEPSVELPGRSPEDYSDETSYDLPETPPQVPGDPPSPPYRDENPLPPVYQEVPPMPPQLPVQSPRLPKVGDQLPQMPNFPQFPEYPEYPPFELKEPEPEPVPFAEEEESFEEPLLDELSETLYEDEIQEEPDTYTDESENEYEDDKQVELPKVVDLLGFLHELTEALPEKQRNSYGRGKLKIALGSIIDSLKNMTIIKESMADTGSAVNEASKGQEKLGVSNGS